MLVNGKRILRVFPRKKAHVPNDGDAFIGDPPLFRPDPSQVDEVHVSCAFSWDIDESERLRQAWARYYPVVKVGGPAYDDPGGDFEPGVYVKQGYVLTSRGCPFNCEFCAVPRREGKIRTLPIRDGHKLEDSNILACPRSHIEAVFEMLARQKKRPIFSGGIGARLLKPWHCEAFKRIKTQTLYLAYDTPKSREPVQRAIAMLREADIKVGVIRCFVLCGYEGDTPEAAEERMVWLFRQGCVPLAMYWRPYDLKTWATPPGQWADIVQNWIWDRCIYARMQREHGLKTADL